MREALAGKMIGNLSNDELNKTLLLIYSIIGLRSHHYPTLEDDILLFSFIRSEYAIKTREELILAFKLAIKDELDIEDTKVYDQFTCEYLARIMTAYRKWLMDKDKKLMAQPKAPVENTPVEITWEEKFYDLQELKQDPDRKMQLIPPYFYDWLTDFGMIRHTPLEKKRLLGEAVEYREGELKAAAEIDITGQRGDKTELIKFQSLMVNGFIKGSSELNRLITLSKQIGVWEYLKHLKGEK